MSTTAIRARPDGGCGRMWGRIYPSPGPLQHRKPKAWRLQGNLTQRHWNDTMIRQGVYNNLMAILDENTLDFISNGLEQTVRLGVRLGELLGDGDVICLSGELGAGKTAFARGIGRGWGAARRVTSPSFTLVSEYPRLHDGLTLYHVDCYRLESPADVATVGLEEILDDSGAVMIEWPERIEWLLPEDRLWVALRYVSETRRGMRITAGGERMTTLLKQFRQNAFGV